MKEYTVIIERYGEDGPEFDEYEFQADGHRFPDSEHVEGFVRFTGPNGGMKKAFKAHDVAEIHVDR